MQEKKSKMFALVEQWRKSGLTRRVFAEKHRLGIQSFDYWCKKHYNEVLKNSHTTSFIEVSPSPIFIENKSRPQIELELPNGLQIRIY